LTKKWQISEPKIAKVVSIAMCPQEKYIAIALANSTIATTTLPSLIDAE